MARKITKIEATPKQQKAIRVAAYCRISTLLDNQLSSIENQKEHYTSLITKHTGWELAGIYIEEGVTGTKMEVRPELNRLLADCKAGKIDLILTKSISRFARNVTDCLEMVRSLTSLGVRIFFEKENLDTGCAGNEFILTILGSLAEEESHSISENEKWSIQKRMQDGNYHQSKAPYGFCWSNGTNGDLIPDPVEAAVVRWMFDKVLEGEGTSWIAKELNSAGLPSPQDSKWCDFTVRKIIQNPAVVGDVLMNKAYRDKEYKTHLNLGEKPLYYQDGHHEAIVSRETYDLANAAIRQRGKEKGNAARPPEERALHNDPHTNRYPFTGKLICGECGATMKRITQNTKSGKRYHWSCTNHLHGDGCSMKRVLEDNVKNAFLTMVNKLNYADFLLDEFCEKWNRAEKKKNEDRIAEIDQELQQNTEKRNRLALLLQSGCVEPVSYSQGLLKLDAEAAALKEELSGVMDTRDNPAAEFRRFLRSGPDSFPDEDFGKYVEKVIVHSQTRFTFVLTCGLELTEEIGGECSETISDMKTKTADPGQALEKGAV